MQNNDSKKFTTTYESVVMLMPNLNQQQLKETLKSIDEKISKGAKITGIEDIGVKKLAYEIKKNKEGYYIVYEFELEDTNRHYLSEIERFYRIKDEIMKYMIIKKD